MDMLENEDATCSIFFHWRNVYI